MGNNLDPHALLLDARRLAAQMLAEDGPSDITTDVTGASGPCEGSVRTRDAIVVAGLAYAGVVAAQAGATVEWVAADGGGAEPDAELGILTGEASAVLRVERPLLNILQRACGIATATRRFVEAVSGTGCRVLHTRKTAPGLRLFDAAAVVAGGGHLHRIGLDRVVMLKDNHWALLREAGRSLESLVQEARRRNAAAVQVEVESADQVELACRAGVDRLLIDNSTPQEFAVLAALARQCAPAVEIEATGGITLETVGAYANAGADFVSIGALTHSVQAADLTIEVL